MEPSPVALMCVKFQTVDALLILALVLLIMCSAFFSASETAFLTSNAIRIKNYANDKVKGARKALYIIENFDKTLSTILVGNNLVNIASTTICAYLFGKFILNPTLANLLNTVIMTIIILIFGEIMPKSFAKINPEKFALRFSGLLYVIIKLFTPIVFLFYKMQQLLKKNVKIEENPTVTEDELESIIDTMEDEGVISSYNADIIQSGIDISDTVVTDIMTPRVDIVAISVDEDFAEIIKVITECNHSRIPVYEDNIDHIVGILNQKDLFNLLIKNNFNESKVDIKKIMRKPLFVNETLSVDELIHEIQKNKMQLAVILDEYGGTSGIATMEDAVEEIVGEIYDEHDSDELPEIVKIGKDVYDLDPEMYLEDLFEELEIEHYPDSQASSLGRFLYELSDNLPKQGDVIEYDTVDDVFDKKINDYVMKNITMKFTLTDVEDNRIRRVKLEVKRTEQNAERKLEKSKLEDKKEEKQEKLENEIKDNKEENIEKTDKKENVEKTDKKEEN